MVAMSPMNKTTKSFRNFMSVVDPILTVLTSPFHSESPGRGSERYGLLTEATRNHPRPDSINAAETSGGILYRPYRIFEQVLRRGAEARRTPQRTPRRETSGIRHYLAPRQCYFSTLDKLLCQPCVKPKKRPIALPRVATGHPLKSCLRKTRRFLKPNRPKDKSRMAR